MVAVLEIENRVHIFSVIHKDELSGYQYKALRT